MFICYNKNMKKLLLLLGTLFLFTGSVMAYELPRWSINPVEVYIPENAYSDTVKSAFEQWSNASGGLIRFRYASTRFASNNSNIKVEFKNEKASYLPSNSKRFETVGYFKDMTAGYLYRANLTLYTMDKNGKPIATDKLQAAAMHEIGYIIGLEKNYLPPQKDKNLSIMDMNNAGIISQPSAEDIQKLIKIYSRSSSDEKK